MIYEITYANKKYERALKLNLLSAKLHGADRVIGYSERDIDKEYIEKNKHIWIRERGGGYWIWKPYIILKTLDLIGEDDVLLYCDAGTVFVNSIRLLKSTMDAQQVDIMPFQLLAPEKQWTKRDAFILMECDSPEYTETSQILSGYILMRKNERVKKLFSEFLEYAQDERIITDNDNVLGQPNYEGFNENRHDQTIFSLLCKKYGLKTFRDPSQYGLYYKDFYSEDVKNRSTYPQIVNSHRLGWFGIKDAISLLCGSKKKGEIH